MSVTVLLHLISMLMMLRRFLSDLIINLVLKKSSYLYIDSISELNFLSPSVFPLLDLLLYDLILVALHSILLDLLCLWIEYILLPI